MRFIALAFAFLCTVCLAQDWPARPLRLIVPFAPGSSPDVFARLLAERMAVNVKQPVVVENKAGAGGMIGTEAIARAVPDGYTFGVSITGPLVNNTLLYRKMPYDPFTDLAPITLAVSQPCVLVASARFNASTLPEAIAELERRPGAFNYASLGAGTMAHLAMERVASLSGTRIVQIAYPGSAQALQALIRNDVQLGCLPASAVMPFVKAGKLKALGIASKKRSPLMPEVKTLSEQGLRDFEANAWLGVVAPARTPHAILARLHDEVVRVLQQTDMRHAMEIQMMEPVGNTPEQFAAYMREELERWGPIIRASHITLD